MMKDHYKKIRFIVLSVFSFLWIFPLIWSVLISFKTEVESVKWPLTFLPKNFTLANYIYIFKDPQSNLVDWIKNSLINATSYTILVLIVCTLAAYPLARFNFKFKNAIFNFLIATMMIPGILNIVPLYATVNRLGISSGRLALILPGIPTVFGLFLLRQFFLTIPKELEEAAMIDGADHFLFFRSILIPLVKPALVVLALTSYLANWNDFLWPNIVVSKKSQQTLTLGLSIIKGQYGNHLPRLMAITVVSLILPISFYIIFNKYIVKGIDVSSGIK